jgi:hypothetical protein
MIAHDSEIKGKSEDIKAFRRIQAVLGEEARGQHGPTTNFQLQLETTSTSSPTFV